MRKVNHLDLLNQLQHTLHEFLMRWVIVHIVFAITGIVELDDKCMRDPILRPISMVRV